MSALLRESILEKIENDIVLEVYDKAMAEHLDDTSLSFDELVSNVDSIV